MHPKNFFLQSKQMIVRIRKYYQFIATCSFSATLEFNFEFGN